MTSIRVVRWPVSARNDVGPRPGSVVGQPLHRLGDGDRVDRDVREVDLRHRPFGGRPQVRLRELVRGDAGEQVRRMDDEAIVEPDLAGDRPGGSLGEDDERVRGGRVRPALEQAREQQVALLPADELLVLVDDVRAGQQLLRLQLDEDGRDQDELREHVHRQLVPPLDEDRDERVDDRRQRDLQDVDLVAADEVQQQVDRPFEDRGRDRVRHGPTLPRRLAHPSDPSTRPWKGRPAVFPYHVAPWPGSCRACNLPGISISGTISVPSASGWPTSTATRSTSSSTSTP